MSQSTLHFKAYSPAIRKMAQFVLRAVFNEELTPGEIGSEIPVGQYMAMFAYKVLADMQISQEHAVNILRFFRDEFMGWDDRSPFILSLNDGRNAVVIMQPECRRLYDYVDDVDRSHPTGAIPLPVPVVQASVNLARAIELGLDIR